jgi:poly-beta-1,6-N-acetyl-D-glucosamine synthesis protein
MIIQTKIHWFREIVISILSIFVWLYCMGVVLFFISALFNYNDQYINQIKIAFKMTNRDIRDFIFMIFFIWFFFYIGLWGWKNYNLKKFGQLNRRLQPNLTAKDDLLSLELMNEEDFQLLHQSRLVIFEKNPIKDLRK